jgi:phosphoglycerol transferase MdoB-like AlkP superfamily enzyme
MIRRATRQNINCTKIVTLCWLFVFAPRSAWALQTHPAPEGLYAHMLAHLFFIATLGIFTYWLQTTGLVRERGWRLIQLCCLMFILWNLDTFTVHWIEHTLTSEFFITTGLDWSQRLSMTGGWRSWVYYFGKFDHLLCVPAMLLLLFGLRDLYRRAGTEGFSHHEQ